MKASGLYRTVGHALQARLDWIDDQMELAKGDRRRAFFAIMQRTGIDSKEMDRMSQEIDSRDVRAIENLILQRAREAIAGGTDAPLKIERLVAAELARDLEVRGLAEGRIRALRHERRALQEIQAIAREAA